MTGSGAGWGCSSASPSAALLSPLQQAPLLLSCLCRTRTKPILWDSSPEDLGLWAFGMGRTQTSSHTCAPGIQWVAGQKGLQTNHATSGTIILRQTSEPVPRALSHQLLRWLVLVALPLEWFLEPSCPLR